MSCLSRDNNGEGDVNDKLARMQLNLPGARVVFDVVAKVGDWVRNAVAIILDARLCQDEMGSISRLQLVV